MNFKKIAALIVKYKKELSALLESLNYDDIEKGMLVINDDLINNEYKDILINKSNGYLSDYTVEFKDGFIGFQLSINAKQLGPIEIDYQLHIQEFRFDATGHKIYATFKENSISLGNMAQKLALKAALVNGPLIKTLLQFTDISYIFVDGNNILIDFDKSPFKDKIPDMLSLNFVSSTASNLRLSFNIKES